MVQVVRCALLICLVAATTGCDRTRECAYFPESDVAAVWHPPLPALPPGARPSFVADHFHNGINAYGTVQNPSPALLKALRASTVEVPCADEPLLVDDMTACAAQLSFWHPPKKATCRELRRETEDEEEGDIWTLRIPNEGGPLFVTYQWAR